MIFQSKNLSLKIKNSTEATKIHVVVPKTPHLGAVKRNLIKRRIKNVGRYFLTNNPSKKNQSIVFYVKKTIDQLSYQEIKKEVLDLLKKSSLLQGKQ